MHEALKDYSMNSESITEAGYKGPGVSELEGIFIDLLRGMGTSGHGSRCRGVEAVRLCCWIAGRRGRGRRGAFARTTTVRWLAIPYKA